MFEPMYILFVLIPSLVISGAASWAVKSAFNKYSRVRARSGLTARKPPSDCWTGRASTMSKSSGHTEC